MPPTSNLRILHLSDPHVGIIPPPKPGASGPDAAVRSAHFFEDSGRPDPAVLAGVIVDDPECDAAGAIVVSGDIGWSGSHDDYESAFEFLQRLREKWPPAQFVIAPGNHDVDLRPGIDNYARQEAFISLLRRFHTSEFEERYPLFAAPGGATRQRLVAFAHIPDQLLIVAANSAASINEDKGPIYIEPSVLVAIRREITSLGVSGRALRVFVVHHHLLPFAEPPWSGTRVASGVPDHADPTIIANSAKLQAWLAANSFHMVLHGHKHLSHGRDDVLWRREDPQSGRRLLIVGAGSCGVARGGRDPGEALSYNVVDAMRLGEKRWNVRVATRQIADEELEPTAASLCAFERAIGTVSAGSPTVFSGERMDDCHRAITATRGKGLIRSFLSVVDDATYVYPQTVRIGDDQPSDAQVRRSFRDLHPEYREGTSWNDLAGVDRELRNLTSRYQFQHGPRLFGVLGRAGRQPRAGAGQQELRPILHAVTSLERSETRAYVGLYNPEIDVGAYREQPLPGLMSIQFVPGGTHLDAVATFRKLELSFWWAVNTLEIGELLRWAARRAHKRPRRVTFFAAVAEWKDNPEATFVTRLDEMPLDGLLDVLIQVDRGDPAARLELLSTPR